MKPDTNKLFLVTCTDMTHSIAGGVRHGVAYVVAKNPSDAYEKLKTFLVEQKIGHASDREMKCIELLAEEGSFIDCGTRLFL